MLSAKSNTTHSFPVFSIIEDDGSVRTRSVQCNNCGIVHIVDEIGRSRIVKGRETTISLTIDDLAESMNEKLVSLLKRHNVDDISLWEELKFIIENEKWGSFVVVGREHEGGRTTLKIIRIVGMNTFIVDVETRDDLI